jgi:predicted transcriptional regulator
MVKYKGLERVKYDGLNSLIVLARCNEEVNAIDLQNYRAFDGMTYLVDKGYATRRVESKSEQELGYYKITKKGKAALEKILKDIEFD